MKTAALELTEDEIAVVRMALGEYHRQIDGPALAKHAVTFTMLSAKTMQGMADIANADG